MLQIKPVDNKNPRSDAHTDTNTLTFGPNLNRVNRQRERGREGNRVRSHAEWMVEVEKKKEKRKVVEIKQKPKANLSRNIYYAFFFFLRLFFFWYARSPKSKHFITCLQQYFRTLLHLMKTTRSHICDDVFYTLRLLHTHKLVCSFFLLVLSSKKKTFSRALFVKRMICSVLQHSRVQPIQNACSDLFIYFFFSLSISL